MMKRGLLMKGLLVSLEEKAKKWPISSQESGLPFYRPPLNILSPVTINIIWLYFLALFAFSLQVSNESFA